MRFSLIAEAAHEQMPCQQDYAVLLRQDRLWLSGFVIKNGDCGGKEDMAGWDFTRTFDPAVQPDDVYCHIFQVPPGRLLTISAQFSPDQKGFELEVNVYLAGNRLAGPGGGAVISNRPIPTTTPQAWSSPANNTGANQTYRVAGFWKDQYGGQYPWYAAVLEQTGGDGVTTWDGSFYHRQPGLFYDNVGDVHIRIG